MQDRPPSMTRPLLWVGVATVAALLGFAGGLAIASALLKPEDGELEARLTSAEAQISQAHGQLRELEADLAEREAAYQETTQALEEARESESTLRIQLTQAQARLSSAQEELTQKTSELERLSSAQPEIALPYEEKLEDLKDMADALERHRLLLVELRKDPPPTRDGALAHWSKVKSLASQADPSLVSPVDRVILKIDNYFDWDDRAPSSTASSQERLNWLADYSLSGAMGYEEAIGSFTKDALLAVITQLDLVVGRLE